MKFRARQVQTRPDEFAIPLLKVIALSEITAEADRRTLEAMRGGGSTTAVGARMQVLVASLDGLTRAQLEGFDAKNAW